MKENSFLGADVDLLELGRVLILRRLCILNTDYYYCRHIFCFLSPQPLSIISCGHYVLVVCDNLIVLGVLLCSFWNQKFQRSRTRRSREECNLICSTQGWGK